MKKVQIVISNSGDGSNALYFFENADIDTLRNLDEITGDYEGWGSGDGVQITTLTFPDDFDLTTLGVPFDNLEEIIGEETL